MKFDKLVFKNYYGKPYVMRIKADIIICAGCILIILILLLLRITIHPLVAGLLIFPIVVSLFPVMPLLISYYIKALKASERQTQSIENGVLYVSTCPEPGFTWGSIVIHTIKYEITDIKKVLFEDRFICVEGNILCEDTYNGAVKKSNLSIVRIPRNFSNSDEIKILGGIKND